MSRPPCPNGNDCSCDFCEAERRRMRTPGPYLDHPLAIQDRDNLSVLAYALEVAHNESLLSHAEYREAKAYLEETNE